MPLDSVGAAACCSYYQRVISIEVRPFSRTIDTRTQGWPAKGLDRTEPRVIVKKAKGGFSLAWLMRDRFCTQRGALLGRGMMARIRAPQGLFLVLRQWL